MSQKIRESNLNPIPIQTGYGFPTHISPAGSLYFDFLTGIQYQNKDGVVNWVQFVDTVNKPIDIYVTGGTYNYSTGIATFVNNTGGTFTLYGFNVGSGGGGTFTGGTIVGGANFLAGLTSTTISTTSISATTYQNLPKDVYVTGATYSNGTATFTNNTGGAFSVSGFKTSDIYVTGATYSNGTAIFTNNTGGTFNVSGFYTGYTAPIDVYVTGGTYSNGTTVFTNNTGGTFSVTGFSTGVSIFTGGTVTGPTIFTNGLTANTLSAFTITTPSVNANSNGLTATTISATTYLNLPIDITITGGTYNSGTATFTNNTGGTFSVTGFKTSDIFVTGGTYSSSSAIFKNNTGGTFTVTGFTTPFTGGTVNGLTATTISATTYQNLPTDIRVTGGTYSNGTSTFTNNTGGTFTLTGFTTPSSLFGAYLPLSGGTVSGNTIFTSGLTANTLNITNYIDFNTGTTIPVNTSGRVYYNNQSHSLAYFPDIAQSVSVEMGQQLYIRGYNATGTLIPKGSALSIQSATAGLPNFTLAANIHSGHGQLVGLAASDIPNASNGLALSQGILSGLTLNTFSVGDILYVSPFSAGTYVAGTSSFPFTARTNQVGYVISTGTSTGQIYVSINNEDENLSLTDIERNILEGNVISTGLYNYTGMTQGTGQTINIAAINGWIAYNTYTYATLPDVKEIIYTGGTNIPLTYLNSADATYVLINSASTIVQQTTFPTPQQRRENIFLGKVVHPNRATITSINQTVDFDVSPMAAIRDLWTPLKLINQGIIPSPNGVNLSINTSAGTLWGNGIGWVTNQLNPDSVSISGTSPTTFQYRTQLGPITGGTAPYTGNTTFIDPAHYDNNGVVTNVGGGPNSSTNQRIYIFPTGLVRIQYGQTVYSNLAAAVAGSQTESFVEYANNRDNGILIGILSVNKNATQLSNSAQAVFNLVSKFGELLGGTGGLSTTTLQQAYDNSTTPEIIINATLDGLTIQNGTGNADAITHLLEGQNTSGATTSFITAAGGFSGSSVSATTYYGLPIDIRTTGATYSNNTFTFTNNTGETFNVVFNTLTGLTINGGLTVTGNTSLQGLTASTVSATTYQNLPTDIRTTGATYSSNTFTYTNNTGGTYSVLFNTFTGLTGNTLAVTGLTTQTSDSFLVTANSGGTLNRLGGNVANRILYFNSSSAITTDSNFIYSGNTLSLTNSGTSQIVLGNSGGGISCNNGVTSTNLTFEVAFGQTGTPDTSKGFLFRNKTNNNYLLLDSPSSTQNRATFYGTVIINNSAAAANYWGANGITFQTASVTYSDTSSSGTKGDLVANSFAIPNFIASSGTTYSGGLSTVYIAGAPTLDVNVSGNTYALKVNSGNSLFNGNITVTGTTISPAFSGNNSTITGTKGTITTSGSSTTAFISVSGSNTVGGTGYTDFIRVTNNSAGATNATKTIRVNNTGGIEFLNSAYTAQILTLGDNGILFVGGGNVATTSSADGVSNYLNFGNNNSQIYDDGNMHIHSRNAGQSLWINTNGGQINLLTQPPTSTGGIGSGIAIATTTLNGYVSINTGKTVTTSANYGYLTTSGAGTYPGGSQSVSISLYATQRIWGQEIDAFSDERMKNIQGEIKLDEAIKLVNDLKPIKYTWKEGEDKGLKAGYSAQQVVKSGFDHLIGLIPTQGLEETIDEDGFVSPKDTQFAMNYDQVTPYHGVVIKYLLEKIQTLEKEIQDLKSK